MRSRTCRGATSRRAIPAGEKESSAAVPVEAPKGSLVVHHGALWHGSFPRTEPGLRIGMAYAFTRAFMTPLEEYRETVTKEMLEQPSAAVRHAHGASGPDWVDRVGSRSRQGLLRGRSLTLGLNGIDAMTQVPIAGGVFTWPSDTPHLLGARCGDCGTHTFPAQAGCPRCGSESMATVELADRGTLFTFTTQEFLPKEPYTGPETEDDFAGFVVGYVELPGRGHRRDAHHRARSVATADRHAGASSSSSRSGATPTAPR